MQCPMLLSNEENVIQAELEKFYDFTWANKLELKKKKWFVMKFSLSKNYDFPAELQFGGSDILEVKKEHVILGIKVQEYLKCPSQCEEMVKRATSTTWALRRMRALGCPRPPSWSTGRRRAGSGWSTAAQSGTPA